MAGFQKVIVLGNLGKDPESKILPNGTATTKFSMAVGKKYKTSSGEQKDETEWFNVVLFQKQAELAAAYLKKGSQVLIVGEMKTRSWEKDGQKHFMTELVAREMTFVGKASAEGTAAPAASAPSESYNDDDVPF